MKSSEYWEKTALLREIAVQEGATLTAEEVLKLYDEALDDINTEIQKIKANFQRRYGLDNETASYFLTQAQQEENLNSLIYALENAPTEKQRKNILEFIHRDGLSVRAYASRIERYNAVKQSIYARLKKLAADETGLVTAMLKKAYSESYYGNIDDTAKGLDVGINFGILNDRAITEAVTAKWHGKRFSDRIWDNTDKLAQEAQELVTRSLMSGESLSKTAQKLSARFQVEKYHATTLVHTETAHIHAMADMQAYKDLGIEEYRYLATLDYATCEMCQPLDGKVFKLSQAREGINYPTMHPRCRCTTTMNTDINSRRARNPLTGRNEIIDGSTTYSEWVRGLTPEQKSALELSRKKNSRRAADKLQFAEYKNRLGTKVVGRSFDKWQEMEYTEKEKYNDLKGFFRYKGNNPKATQNDYNCVKELRELFPQGSFHIPAKEIDVSKLSFDDKHINSEREHNVSENVAKEFIRNAKVSRTVWNGQFERFYSYEGVTYVDNENKLIRTAFKKEQFKGDATEIMEVLKKYGI